MGIQQYYGMDEYQLAGNIMIAAKEVHKYLGPNQLECNYESCLAFELRQMGLDVKQQVGRPFQYKGTNIEFGYRMNLIVQDKILVEVRSVEGIYDIHKVKLLTYMKNTDFRYGIVLNFNVSDIFDGVKRIVRRE